MGKGRQSVPKTVQSIDDQIFVEHHASVMLNKKLYLARLKSALDYAAGTATLLPGTI
jgi:hypothetical protein